MTGEAEIARIKSRTERFRKRAASAATLTAGITGAVVVGLVLNTDLLPPLGPARGAATGTVALLLAAVGLWAVAAQQHLRPALDPVWFRSARLKQAKSAPERTSKERAEITLRRVVRTVDIAAVCSLSGLGALLLTLLLLVWTPTSVRAEVILHEPLSLAVCSEGRTQLEGYFASQSDAAASTAVLFVIDAGQCRERQIEVRLDPAIVEAVVVPRR